MRVYDKKNFYEDADVDSYEAGSEEEIDLSEFGDDAVDDGSIGGSNIIVAYDDEDAQAELNGDPDDVLTESDKKEIASIVYEMQQVSLTEAKTGKAKYPKTWIWRTTKNGHKIAFDKQGRVVAGNPHVVKFIRKMKKKARDARANKKYYEKNKERLNKKRTERRRAKRNAAQGLVASASLVGLMSEKDKNGRTVSYMGESIYLDDMDKNAKMKLENFLNRVSGNSASQAGSDLALVFRTVDEHISNENPELATAIVECVGDSERFDVKVEENSVRIFLDGDSINKYRTHTLAEQFGGSARYDLRSAKLSDGTQVGIRDGIRGLSGVSEIRISLPQ